MDLDALLPKIYLIKPKTLPTASIPQVMDARWVSLRSTDLRIDKHLDIPFANITFLAAFIQGDVQFGERILTLGVAGYPKLIRASFSSLSPNEFRFPSKNIDSNLRHACLEIIQGARLVSMGDDTYRFLAGRQPLALDNPIQVQAHVASLYTLVRGKVPFKCPSCNKFLWVDINKLPRQTIKARCPACTSMMSIETPPGFEPDIARSQRGSTTSEERSGAFLLGTTGQFQDEASSGEMPSRALGQASEQMDKELEGLLAAEFKTSASAPAPSPSAAPDSVPAPAAASVPAPKAPPQPMPQPGAITDIFQIDFDLPDFKVSPPASPSPSTTEEFELMPGEQPSPVAPEPPQQPQPPQPSAPPPAAAPGSEFLDDSFINDILPQTTRLGAGPMATPMLDNPYVPPTAATVHPDDHDLIERSERDQVARPSGAPSAPTCHVCGTIVSSEDKICPHCFAELSLDASGFTELEVHTGMLDLKLKEEVIAQELEGEEPEEIMVPDAISLASPISDVPYWEEKVWFLKIGEEIYPNVDMQTIEQWIHDGSVVGTDLAKKGEDGKWTDISSVPYFKKALQHVDGAIQFGSGTSFTPATIPHRLQAALVDGFICVLLGFLGKVIFAFSFGKSAGVLITFFGYLFFPLLYLAIGNGSFGRTVGKALLHLAVVNKEGQPAAFPKGLLRALVTIGTAGLGFFAALSDQRHQALHDKVAGTYVIHLGD